MLDLIQILRIEAECRGEIGEPIETNPRSYHFPKILDTSEIFTDPCMWDAVYSYLTPSCSLKKAKLLFIASQHGYNLKTLQSRVKGQVEGMLFSIFLEANNFHSKISS
jgi:hypothetical protein